MNKEDQDMVQNYEGVREDNDFRPRVEAVWKRATKVEWKKAKKERDSKTSIEKIEKTLKNGYKDSWSTINLALKPRPKTPR